MPVWSRVAVTVQITHSCDCLADWELAVHPERVSYRLLPTPEKSSKSQIQHTVSKECILLSHRRKIIIQTVVNRGAVCRRFQCLGEISPWRGNESDSPRLDHTTSSEEVRLLIGVLINPKCKDESWGVLWLLGSLRVTIK